MTETKPTVLFVCNSNKGKSQMAAALLEHEAPGKFTVESAGVKASVGEPVNQQAAASLAEIGADMSTGTPTQLNEDAMRAATRVIVVGGAQLPEVDGVEVERWETDEPSERGIEGEERMNLIRDDIHARVQNLVQQF
ncbi:low molecular weight phosphatase family protein [Rothia terrae]|uniref:Low molecular weight phosphatase family protein n=1 Tax=Rothia terrae TaxID=396015 RepID=A0A7H2BER2_9MICC|nr:low molecular weight phosphatase family protein [Rothia terrae]MDT0189959.1 low molecular weight phosphatase family protein [Rothia terrae]NKZ34398.1 low molecular weight phosphatase family protein [Rothia terrae]QNV38158.1 low molecular weight phosphatase family protein [Rothia terrae]